jgi:hypothetical protein
MAAPAVQRAHYDIGQMLPVLWLIHYLAESHDCPVERQYIRAPLPETDSPRQRHDIDWEFHLRPSPALAFISCANPGGHDEEIV